MARKRDLVWLISFTASKCRQPKEKGAWHVVFYTPIYRNMCAIWRITPQKRTTIQKVDFDWVALVWIFARLWVRPQRLSNYYVNKSQFEFNNKNKDSTFLAFLQFFSEFMLFYVGIYNATVFLEFVLYRRDRHQVIILSTYFVLTGFSSTSIWRNFC